MKEITRRSVMAGSAAIVASGAAVSVPVAMASPSVDPNKHVLDLQSALKAAYAHVTPITPAEYVREMEANGWIAITRIGRDGEPRGVFEFTVDYPTDEAMSFLRYINCRVGKSGSGFYGRAARYLAEQGRGVHYEIFDQRGWRPGQCTYDWPA
jgi:hypothetical protein